MNDTTNERDGNTCIKQMTAIFRHFSSQNLPPIEETASIDDTTPLSLPPFNLCEREHVSTRFFPALGFYK